MNSLGNERNATRRLVKNATAQRPKGQVKLSVSAFKGGQSAQV